MRNKIQTYPLQSLNGFAFIPRVINNNYYVKSRVFHMGLRRGERGHKINLVQAENLPVAQTKKSWVERRPQTRLSRLVPCQPPASFAPLLASKPRHKSFNALHGESGVTGRRGRFRHLQSFQMGVAIEVISSVG